MRLASRHQGSFGTWLRGGFQRLNRWVCLYAQSSDVAGYDEYVEGVEAEETTSLDTPLQEVGK